MPDIGQVVKSAIVTGTVASLMSTAALALLARAEGRGAIQPTNATSHWLHGDAAGYTRRVDARHTGLGYLTHHLSAIFWALPLQLWLAAQRRPRPASHLVRDAAIMSAIAAIVDYAVVPRRLTPGWESVLTKRSIAAAYVALAGGLALGASLTNRRAPGLSRT